jgi:hypothetical protein
VGLQPGIERPEGIGCWPQLAVVVGPPHGVSLGGLASREAFPPLDGDLHVLGLQLDGPAAPPGLLRGDDVEPDPLNGS